MFWEKEKSMIGYFFFLMKNIKMKFEYVMVVR